MNELPRYVKLKNGINLSYQRRVSKQLCEATGCSQHYRQSLGLKLGATPTQIHNALSKAHEAYDVHVKMLSNSSPDALDDTELDLAAAALLRRVRRKPSEFAWLQPRVDAIDKASIAVFGNDEDIWSLQTEEKYWKSKGVSLNREQTIQKRAVEKLLQHATHKPKTIMSLYHAYNEAKGYKNPNLTKQEKRDKLRSKKRLGRFVAMLGDRAINNDTPSQLRAALMAYKNERIAQVTPSSVSRELNDMMAFIKWCRDQYGFDWQVSKPVLGNIASKPRHPLNKEEQQKLVRYCVSTNVPDKDRIACCIALLELQGGMMQSEIKRLEPEGIKLDSAIPYIMITGVTKTNQRKRLVPIVLGLDFIKENFKETHAWVKRVTESSVSRKMRDFLRRVTGNKTVTAHCLRHTLKWNTDLNNVSAYEAASIGGWSGGSIGVSQHMLNYGAEGIEYEGRIKTIQDTSLKIHKHLLGSNDDSNVIQLYK